MAIAVVDPGGHLVYFERMQNTQTGSVRIAIEKARSGVMFRRRPLVYGRAKPGHKRVQDVS
jgi:glc operon protein GlcG